VRYRVELASRVAQSLAKLPRDVQSRLAEQIASLADNPRPASARAIKGYKDCYRIRQGDYRVVYTVLDDKLFVLVVRAGHRKDVYDRMEMVARTIQRFRESGA
jgi:mRNA interferase RelE/StbE